MIALVLPLPPSANRLYRAIVQRGRPRQIKSKEYRDYEDLCALSILRQRPHRVPDGPLVLSAWFYWPTRRRRDLDNCAKSLQDVIANTLGFDDSRICELHLYRRHDRKDPRVEVELEAA